MNAPITNTQGGDGKTQARAASVHPLRAISFNDPAVSIERRPDGIIHLRPTQPLEDFPRRITDRLLHFAEATPDRIFMAERQSRGGKGWRELTYAELLAASRHIASALLQRGL